MFSQVLVLCNCQNPPVLAVMIAKGQATGVFRAGGAKRIREGATKAGQAPYGSLAV